MQRLAPTLFARSLLCVFAAMLLASLLTACGGGQPEALNEARSLQQTAPVPTTAPDPARSETEGPPLH